MARCQILVGELGLPGRIIAGPLTICGKRAVWQGFCKKHSRDQPQIPVDLSDKWLPIPERIAAYRNDRYTGIELGGYLEKRSWSIVSKYVGRVDRALLMLIMT